MQEGKSQITGRVAGTEKEGRKIDKQVEWALEYGDEAVWVKSVQDFGRC